MAELHVAAIIGIGGRMEVSTFILEQQHLGIHAEVTGAPERFGIE